MTSTVLFDMSDVLYRYDRNRRIALLAAISGRPAATPLPLIKAAALRRGEAHLVELADGPKFPLWNPDSRS